MRKQPMKKLLLNADDFGRDAKINAAIRDGVSRGVLRSASLMAGEPAFEDAVRVARSLPELEIGIHLTLVDGTPVLPAKELPTLVPDGKGFYPSHREFVQAYFSGKIHREEIRRELAAQAEKVLQTGLRVTHVDSHQHMHVLPGIFSIVLSLMQAHGLRALRIPKCSHPARHLLENGVGAAVGRLGLWTLAVLAGAKAKREGYGFPHAFIGEIAGGAMTENMLLGLLPQLEDGTTEVMIHPGYDNGYLAPICHWDHDFEAEAAACSSEKVKAEMDALHIGIGSFQPQS